MHIVGQLCARETVFVMEIRQKNFKSCRYWRSQIVLDSVREYRTNMKVGDSDKLSQPSPKSNPNSNLGLAGQILACVCNYTMCVLL